MFQREIFFVRDDHNTKDQTFFYGSVAEKILQDLFSGICLQFSALPYSPNSQVYILLGGGSGGACRGVWETRSEKRYGPTTL
jgi:hypothetical protein